jgi:hypothetical protein
VTPRPFRPDQTPPTQYNGLFPTWHAHFPIGKSPLESPRQQSLTRAPANCRGHIARGHGIFVTPYRLPQHSRLAATRRSAGAERVPPPHANLLPHTILKTGGIPVSSGEENSPVFFQVFHSILARPLA